MGKTAFNNGDVVKIVDNPIGVTKKVGEVAGKVGVVVGRKTSRMYVSYLVDIDGTVYQIKHAKNLIGPLPKEALQGDYSIPKTKRSHRFLYNKDYTVIEIDKETDDFFMSTTGHTYKKSSIGKSLRFIPEEYVKYLFKDKNGRYSMSIVARMFFGKNKAFIPAMTFINHLVGTQCLTREKYLEHCITGTPITCGEYAYKFSSYASDALEIDDKTVLTVDLKNMMLASTFQHFPPGLVDKIPKVKEYTISFFNDILGGDLVNEDMLRLDSYYDRSNVTGKLDIQFGFSFDDKNVVKIFYILEDYPYRIASIYMLYDIMRGSTTIAETQINNSKYVEEFRLTSQLTGGLRGILDI